jgi:hypothetical protein
VRLTAMTLIKSNTQGAPRRFVDSANTSIYRRRVNNTPIRKAAANAWIGARRVRRLSVSNGMPGS